MEIKFQQSLKQDAPNDVTDEGIVMEVKLLHTKEVLLVDYQYYTL